MHVTEAIAEASTNGHNVLQCAAELNANGVLDDGNTEHGVVEELLPGLAVLLSGVPDGGLAEILLGDLIRHIRSHQDTAINVIEPLADDVRNQDDPLSEI